MSFPYIEVVSSAIFVMNAVQLAYFIRDWCNKEKPINLTVEEIANNVQQIKHELHDHIISVRAIPTLRDISEESHPIPLRIQRSSHEF